MWWRKTNLIVYSSHFLSCWGNRMWYFGMGMFLVRISNDLQLAAASGLATGLAIFFFGALVGHWVDSTPRFKAAQLSLVLQDAITLVTAAVIFAYLWHQDQIAASPPWLSLLLKAVLVLLGVLAALSAQARLLAVERDWIVEICGKDSDLLASMTAMLRRIDQVSGILAPMATGQVMTYTGLKYGAVLIGGWNVVSVFVEFYLMWKVYNTVPALKAKKHERRVPAEYCEKELKFSIKDTSPEQVTETHNSFPMKSDSSGGVFGSDSSQGQNITTSDGLNQKMAELQVSEMQDSGHVGVSMKSKGGAKRWTLVLVLDQFATLYRGWKRYVRYSVALPGMALACLYLTVLGFDSITIGYATTQGLSESVLGILSGCSAVFGILGTFAYPVIRRRVGLVRTGIIALSCQVSSLILCVVSIWMPGSPFDPFYLKNKLVPACVTTATMTTPAPVSAQDTDVLNNLMLTTSNSNLTVFSTAANTINVTNIVDCAHSATQGPGSYVSVIFLMAGIFLARFGVWVADLSITQLFLEHVQQAERGLVNGVQSSLNQLMDLLKFALVVVLPATETFGFLIIISFTSVFTGWLLYAIFVRRQTGGCLCLPPPLPPSRDPDQP